MPDLIAEGINTRTGRLAPPAEVEPLQLALYRQLHAVVQNCAQAEHVPEQELALFAANIGIRLGAVFHEFNSPDPMRVLPLVSSDDQLHSRALALLYLQKLIRALSSTVKFADEGGPVLVRDALYIVGSRVSDSVLPMFETYFAEPAPLGSVH